MLYMFDVDGTLVRSFLRERGPKHGTPEEAFAYAEVEALPGRVERIRALAGKPGTRFALVTNQGGVAFGYQTPSEVFAKMAAVIAAFENFHGCPVSLHVCFEHPKATVEGYRADSPRRKPSPGMLLEAMRQHLDGGTDAMVALSRSVFVGDMEADRLAAREIGVPYVDAEVFFGR